MADQDSSPAAAAPAPGPAGPAPLTGVMLAVTSIALALGTFMQVLDGTIANVSIPTIAGNLGVSTSQGTWVITSFAVANGVSVPLTGWLMGRYGVVKTFVVSVMLFTIASFLCGISWNLPSLIGFRILQGLVSGPMIPGSQALLIMIFPPSKRGTALAIWSMTTLVAPICGPILGGYISDNIAWPWIFLINVPVGLLCAFLCWRGMSSRETPTRKVPIDTTGFMLLLVWVGALQVMLDTGKEADWFNSPAIVVETLVAIIGFIAWVIWELNEKHPIVDLSLFKSKNFALGTLAFCLGYAVFFGSNLLQPLWLQTRMGYIATWAGLVAAPSGVVAVILTPFAARLMQKVDARWTATLSMAAFALSFFMRSEFTRRRLQGAGLADAGAGRGDEHLLPVDGDHLAERRRAPATAVGLGPVELLADHRRQLRRLAGHHDLGPQRVAAPDPPRRDHGSNDPAWLAAVERMQAVGMSHAQAVGAATAQVVNQAYLLATVDFFRASAWLMVLLIPCIWLTNKAMSGGGAPPPAD
jgi:DHA2 family multidrug resistance protein